MHTARIRRSSCSGSGRLGGAEIAGAPWAPIEPTSRCWKPFVDLLCFREKSVSQMSKNIFFGMIFFSPRCLLDISRVFEGKKLAEDDFVLHEFVGQDCCRPWCYVKRKMWLPKLRIQYDLLLTLELFWPNGIIFHQPGFPWDKGPISLP